MWGFNGGAAGGGVDPCDGLKTIIEKKQLTHLWALWSFYRNKNLKKIFFHSNKNKKSLSFNINFNWKIDSRIFDNPSRWWKKLKIQEYENISIKVSTLNQTLIKSFFSCMYM